MANKSLNFIVRLKGKDACGRENEVAIVKVPRHLPRFFRIPAARGSKQQLFVSISSLIRSHLSDLFPGRQVTEFSQFRVTRHSDLAVDEEEVKNLRTALRQGLQHRHYGQAVRLEVSAGCSAFLSDFLLKQFGLPGQALYRAHGPVNLVRMTQLIDLVDAPSMRFEGYEPAWPQQLVPGQSFFERLLTSGEAFIHGRNSSYLSGTLRFNKMASITTVVYYQPRIFNAWDHRLALEAGFLFSPIPRYTFESRLNLLRDTARPTGVPGFTYSWNNRFGIRF